MPINLDDTRTLLQAIERTHLPTTALIDTFFPVAKTFLTTSVDMEYRKGGRKMAPFVVPGSKGINLGRTGSQLRSYKAPLMRPKRTIEASDIERRGFGEDIYSQRTPEQRAQELRAHDMAELIDSCIRRQEWMAAQLLINGSYECRGLQMMVKLLLLITSNFRNLMVKQLCLDLTHGTMPQQKSMT